MRLISAVFVLLLILYGFMFLQFFREQPQEAAAITVAEEASPKTKQPCSCAVPKDDDTIVATTEESERQRGPDGYGAPIHGVLTLNGHRYRFVSGGRGRGSIPFGTYGLGERENHPYLGGASYRMSDAYDPMVRDTRWGLFIHAGRVSAGCIAIDPDQYEAFVADMAAARPTSLELTPTSAAAVADSSPRRRQRG